MNIFRSAIRRLFQARSKWDPFDDYWYAPVAGPTKSGVKVDASTAMKYSVVWACVRAISETIATLPLNVYRRLPGGGKSRAPNHPLHKLLHIRPNPEMTAVQYREAAQSHILLTGNHYSQIVRDRMGTPVSLWPLDPFRMSVDRESTSGPIVYTYRLSPPDTGTVTFRAEDILHVAGLGFNGLIGYSVITMAQEAIGMGLGLEEFAARFFSNDAHGSGYLQLPQGMVLKDEEAMARLKQSWGSGLDQAHKVKVLEGGVEWKPMTIPMKDAQFIEGRAFQPLEICRFFNVPPYKIFDFTRATWANVEQMAIDWVVHGIRPWLVRWEQSFQVKLFSEEEMDEYFARHVVDGLLRGDVASRNQAYATARQWGWLNVDEIRELEDQNPLPDGQGKIYLVPSNMMAASALTKKEEPAGKADSEEESEPVSERALRSIEAEKLDDLAQEIRQKDLQIMKMQSQMEEREKVAREAQENAENLRAEIEGLYARTVDRETIEGAYRGLFSDAMARIIRREQIGIRNALKKRKNEEILSYLDEFYENLPAFASDTLAPIASSYVGLKSGKTESVKSSLDGVVSDYVAGSRRTVMSWISSSENRENGLDGYFQQWMDGQLAAASGKVLSAFACST